MQIEKEVRFKVGEKEWARALKATQGVKDKSQVLDITCGKYGFESLAKTGMVFRIRQSAKGLKLEIKKRTGNNTWLEESLNLESLKQGLNFLHLAGLEPCLYINRMREERAFKGLKVVFDDVELLGKYIEIEYQDSKNAVAELDEFLRITSIENAPQPLYGDIIKAKVETDKKFRDSFYKKLEELI